VPRAQTGLCSGHVRVYLKAPASSVSMVTGYPDKFICHSRRMPGQIVPMNVSRPPVSPACLSQFIIAVPHYLTLFGLCTLTLFGLCT
jgi:hypothetical protein